MIVIDASVALKWVVDEPGADEAATYLAETMMAPSLWLAEIGNALAGRVRRGELSDDQAARRFQILASEAVNLVDIAQLTRPAYALAIELRHSIYDCLYLALAIRESIRMVTADHSFAKRVRRADLGEFIVTLHGTVTDQD